MHLVFDIFQGIGIASAVGIRPFLPALAVGGLAAGDIQINFSHTDLSFLESAPFLLGMLIGTILLALIERRAGGEDAERGPISLVVAGFALAIAALMFAGALVQNNYDGWPGVIGGVICALIAIIATRPLLARVRSRLDRDTRATLPLFTEAGALVAAVLSVLLPPVGVIVLALLVWLLVAGRGRGEQKYAGLRILR
jgi:hypothetical protein